MSGRLPGTLLALLLTAACGGRAGSPLTASPAERIPPGDAEARRPPGHGSHQAAVAEERAGDGARATDEEAVGDADTDRSEPRATESRQPESRQAESHRSEPGSRAASRQENGEDDEPGEAADEGEAARRSDRAGGSNADDEAGDAVYHMLRAGQTLYSVARAYRVDLATLLDVNGITDPTKVPADTPILIPGLRRSRLHGAPAGTLPAALSWPLQGRITGPFGPRGKHHHHAGIDIDGETGDPILAAASGTVVQAGTDGLYGRRIVLDHGDGLLTLYAHASRLLVREGDEVRAGERIAEVGHSGNAHGSHLHFEVRRDGRAENPLPYLRAGDLRIASAAAAAHPQAPPAKPVAKSGARHERAKPKSPANH